MKNYFNKGHPLTIAMWDYSWLKCGHKGGSFHDLERCVAEAAQRGYNTLRVDVFPHWYLDSHHVFEPQGLGRRVPTWGDVRQVGGYTCNVRERVIELADLARRHGLMLALDTWMSFAILGGRGPIPAGEEEAVCRAWSETWVQALRAMREDGVLERAAWVAPLNEVPLFLGSMLQRVRVSDPSVRHEGQTDFNEDLPELDAVFREINTWLGEAIFAELASDGVPLAYSALGAENYAARVPEFYDVADVHFMPDVLLAPEDRIALNKAGDGAAAFTLHDKQEAFDLTLYSAAWERACERNYDRMLALAHSYAAGALARTTLPSGKQLTAVVTEAYGPCNFPDTPEVSWEAYKRWNGDAARIFAGYDFAGLTISNHAEPLFSLWRDAGWQRQTNAFLKASVTPRR